MRLHCWQYAIFAPQFSLNSLQSTIGHGLVSVYTTSCVWLWAIGRLSKLKQAQSKRVVHRVDMRLYFESILSLQQCCLRCLLSVDSYSSPSSSLLLSVCTRAQFLPCMRVPQVQLSRYPYNFPCPGARSSLPDCYSMKYVPWRYMVWYTIYFGIGQRKPSTINIV